MSDNGKVARLPIVEEATEEALEVDGVSYDGETYRLSKIKGRERVLDEPESLAFYQLPNAKQNVTEEQKIDLFLDLVGDNFQTEDGHLNPKVAQFLHYTDSPLLETVAGWGTDMAVKKKLKEVNKDWNAHLTAKKDEFESKYLKFNKRFTKDNAKRAWEANLNEHVGLLKGDIEEDMAHIGNFWKNEMEDSFGFNDTHPSKRYKRNDNGEEGPEGYDGEEKYGKTAEED